MCLVGGGYWVGFVACVRCLLVLCKYLGHLDDGLYLRVLGGMAMIVCIYVY